MTGINDNQMTTGHGDHRKCLPVAKCLNHDPGDAVIVAPLWTGHKVSFFSAVITLIDAE